MRHANATFVAILVATLCMSGQSHSAHAAIIGVGDITPDLTIWSTSRDGYIGKTAGGTVTVDGGSDLASRDVWLGKNTGVSGVATVTGAGSTCNNTGWMLVGFDGDGTLNVEAGAAVSSHWGYVGYLGGSGVAMVTGADSTWNNTRDLYVGDFGDGTLNVEAGATVSSDWGHLGFRNGSTGIAMVTGVGSTWNNTGPLTIGYSGDGTLSIINDRLVAAQSLHIDWLNHGGDDFVNMSTGGMLALQGDAADSIYAFLGLVAGSDAIRYWNDSATDWSLITSAIPELDYTLAYIDDVGSPINGYTLLTVGVSPTDETVPEPSSLAILALGILGLLVLRQS